MSNNSLALALMLATVLLGISIGGLLGGLLSGKRAWSLPLVAVVAAATVAITYRLFAGALTDATPFSWQTVVAYSVRLILPTAILSGILFTLQGDVLRRQYPNDVRAAGILTLANTTGATCGSLLAGFVLLPQLGLENAFGVVVMLYLATAALLLGRHPRRRLWVSMAALAVATAALFPFGIMQRFCIPASVKSFAADGARVVATRDTPTESISYMRRDWFGEPVYYRLVTNGFSMSGTGVPAKRYMRLYAFWPAAVCPQPIRSALVISYGVGVTVSAVRDLKTVTSIDVVDISRDIVEMSKLIYPAAIHPLNDSRVSLHIEDGRQFLLLTEKRFDLITGEPPPPRLPGTVNLYTREYFQLMHDRLTENGVATYWLPIADLLEADAKTIIRAFGEAFSNYSVWAGTPTDWMLVGFRGAPRPNSAAAFRSLWSDSTIGPQLREMGFESPAQIGATFLGDAAYWNRQTENVAPLTDNYPKRLHPLYSDPGQERMFFFANAVSPPQTRILFRNSPFIKTLLPAEMIEPMDAAFQWQSAVNVALELAPHPVANIMTLHRVLTQTEYSTLPLWLLGANEAVRRIASTATTVDSTGSIEYVQALVALSERRYDAAASLFALAREHGWTALTGRYLEVYALCLAGRTGDAARLAQDLRSNAPGTSYHEFWRFVDDVFHL